MIGGVGMVSDGGTLCSRRSLSVSSCGLLGPIHRLFSGLVIFGRLASGVSCPLLVGFLSVLLSLTVSCRVAYAVTPSDVAIEAGMALISGVASAQQADVRYKRDLVHRWFINPDKQGKVPVTYHGRGAFYQSNDSDMTDTELVPGDLRKFRDYFSDKDGQEQFRIWANLFASVGGTSADYSLVTFDSGDEVWSASSLNADIEYAKWYDYFEGTSGGGGGAEQQGTYYRIPLVWSGLPNRASFNASSYCTVSPRDFNPVDGSFSGSGSNIRYYYNLRQTTHEPILPDTMQVWMASSLYDSFNVDGMDYLLVYSNGSGTSADGMLNVLELPSGSYSIEQVPSPDGPVDEYPPYFSLVATSSFRQFEVTESTSRLNAYAYLSGSLYTVVRSLRSASTKTVPAGTYTLHAHVPASFGGNGYYGYLRGTPVNPVPVYPTPPQPTTPATPTPPDVSLPEPGDPPVDNPGTGTTVNNNTYNVTNNTTTVDLQPILDALGVINDNVKVVSKNFSDFSSYMQGWTGRMYRVVYDWFKVLDDDLRAWARSIYDLLNQWLGIISDQISDWASELYYQLRSVNGWLESIYYEITSFHNAYQPEVQTGNSPSQQLGADIDKLKLKFPFSLPWDVWALLHMLDAPPETPVITFWWPYTDGLVVDFSPLDDVAAVSRTMTLFLFAGGLLLKTKDMFFD